MLEARIPSGPIEQQWDTCRFEMKLVNPANRRKHSIIVVGAGLAGAAAAATLGQQGYHVRCFSYHDTPRRAHSIAAQGGINAAKNYRNDGDSILRLFKDTVKGGDFRAREANVYRLAQLSVNIIDQCVAQGVPFAREYGGLLDNRSFGGVQVERTFYARGQTGQQLLLGAYQALEEQIAAGKVSMHIRSELLDVVIADGRARGIVTRDLVTGHIECHAADVVVLATGGYSNVFYLSTNAKASNCTAIWRAHRRGALFGNPCFTQIHPTCIPLSSEHQSKLTLMSESLRNDGRVWVPKKRVKPAPQKIFRRANAIIIWKAATRVLAISCRAMLPHGTPRRCAMRAAASDRTGRVSIWTSRMPFTGSACTRCVRSTATCSTSISGSRARMRIPSQCGSIPPPTTPWAACGWTTASCQLSRDCSLAVKRTSPTTAPIGSAQAPSCKAWPMVITFCRIPCPTTSPPLNRTRWTPRIRRLRPLGPRSRIGSSGWFLSKENAAPIRSTKSLASSCGMSAAWHAQTAGLKKALARIPELRDEFWRNLRIVGGDDELNQGLEKANRISDFLELAELMCLDALNRAESCGGHFRVESQTPEGEAKRDDANFAYTAAWEWKGSGQAPALHKEPLTFEHVPLSQRSYK